MLQYLQTSVPWLLYGSLAFFPILLWFWAFRSSLPKHKSYLLLTFVAGMLSVVPIKLYERYWNIGVWKLEHTNLFRYMSEVLDLGTFPALITYVLATIIVMGAIFVFVACLMFVLEIFTGDNSTRVFKRKLKTVAETPLFFIMVGVLCGALAFGSSLTLNEKVWMFMVVGILEEFTKHLVLRFSDEEKIHSVGEAVQFSVVVALGFAFIENIQYFSGMSTLTLLNWPQFLLLVGLRSLVSVGAHVSFSAILGYYYGIAKFANEIYQQESLRHQHRVIEWGYKLLHLRNEVLFHDQKMMEGVLFAMGLHGVYNSLLEFGYVTFAMPMVGLMLLVVVYLLHQKDLLQQRGVVVRRFDNQILEAPV